MRTVKSDVVVGLGENGCEIADSLDKEEPGWKISGKYVSTSNVPAIDAVSSSRDPAAVRLSFSSLKADRVNLFNFDCLVLSVVVFRCHDS